MGHMVSIPLIEVVDTYYGNGEPKMQCVQEKNDSNRPMCPAWIGAMISIPMCEAAEVCGGGGPVKPEAGERSIVKGVKPYTGHNIKSEMVDVDLYSI